MEYRERAEFNDALGYLMRINVLFYKADGASMTLDAFGWFHALLGLYRELSTKMKQAEIDEFEKIRKDIAPRINRMVKDPRLNGKIDAKLYDDLHTFEMKLRRVYKESGLEMKFNDDPSMALGGG